MTRSFSGDITKFVAHVESLSTSFPVVSVLMEAGKGHANDNVRTYLEDKGVPVDSDSDRPAYRLPASEFAGFRRLERKQEHWRHASTIIPRSFLVSLVSQFDAYMGSLVRTMFDVQPDLLNSSERNMSFRQLMEFPSIEEARRYIVDKEVESILRESHASQFDWLERKLNMPLRKGLDAWPAFVELTQRRNLFVHADGMVSSQYLEVCRDHGFPMDEDVCVGTELGVDMKYFKEAYRHIFEVGVKLGHVLWRKLAPNDREAADDHLNGIVFELLGNKEHKLAIALGQFGGHEIKQHSEERIRLFMLINLAQAYKWAGSQEQCEKVLDSIDFSARGPEYVYCSRFPGIVI